MGNSLRNHLCIYIVQWMSPLKINFHANSLYFKALRSMREREREILSANSGTK